MDTIRIEVIPRRELFRDDESGFKIYSAEVVNSSDVEVELNEYDNISIKGNNLPDFNIDSVYDLELALNKRDKYKGSYTMTRSYFVKPQSPEDQWKFLKMVVTENQYSKIAEHYSEGVSNIIDIITSGDFEFDKVTGYGETSYNLLRDRVIEDLSVSEAVAYFSEYDISYKTIKRMVRLYGSSEKAIEEINKNPYSIIEKDGFGFLKADELAMKLGISPESPHRIESCMVYLLEEVNKNGDIWIDRKKLYNKMKKHLKIHKKHIDAVIDAENEEVFVYKGRYATKSSAMNEWYLALMIANKVEKEESILKKHGYDPKLFIESFEKENNITLSEQQSEFLYSLDKSNVAFLIGSAGSGKSFSMKIVTDIASSLGLRIELLAPTGRASKVLSNYTLMPASTIHRAIGLGKSVNKDSNPSHMSQDFPADIILVDESSMNDVRLANRLMSAIKKDSLVVFIGDDAQIPSVGEGNFLFDCIHCPDIPKTKLTKIFRQKESGMLDAITKTRKGRAFLNTNVVRNQRIGTNFEFRHMIKEQILSNLIDSYTKLLRGGYNVEDVAILVPTNVGEIGTVNINNEIQKVVNPQSEMSPKDEHTFGNEGNKRTLRVGDYVMNTENLYDAPVVNESTTTDVFNGESGTIIAVNLGSKDIIVDFEGKHVMYSFSEAVKKLNHSWCMTTYKAQGSQFEVVLAVVDSSATYQLNANLLYTAMSRARKFLGVFGQAVTFNKAIQKFANFNRQSFLGEFLDFWFGAMRTMPQYSIEKWKESAKQIAFTLEEYSKEIMDEQ